MRALVCILLLCLSRFVAAEENNRLIACDNSIEAIEWAKEFIAHAEQSIEFSPCYLGGDLCEELLDAFEARLAVCPKLKVTILMSPLFLEKHNRAHLERLEKTYFRQFRVVYTTSIVAMGSDLAFIDNHIKMLVIDETYFVMGGTNYDYSLAAEGSFPAVMKPKEIPLLFDLPLGARDQDVVGSGPLAGELRQLFYKLIALWDEYDQRKRLESYNADDYAEKSPLFELPEAARPYVESFETKKEIVEISCDQLKMIVGGPVPRPNPITQEYCRLIDAAKEEILIGNLYFCPVDGLLDALMRAAKRGVTISVVTNGVNDRAPPYTKLWACANRVCYIPLLYGRKYGLLEKSKCQNDPLLASHIYEYYVKEMVYHKKVMIVDGEYFVIGSYNLGIRSDLSDYELILSIHSKPLAQAAMQVYKKDVDHSKELTVNQMSDWYFNWSTAYEAEMQRKIHQWL